MLAPGLRCRSGRCVLRGGAGTLGGAADRIAGGEVDRARGPRVSQPTGEQDEPALAIDEARDLGLVDPDPIDQLSDDNVVRAIVRGGDAPGDHEAVEPRRVQAEVLTVLVQVGEDDVLGALLRRPRQVAAAVEHDTRQPCRRVLPNEGGVDPIGRIGRGGGCGRRESGKH